jgi:hypothetical protein
MIFTKICQVIYETSERTTNLKALPISSFLQNKLILFLSMLVPLACCDVFNNAQYSFSFVELWFIWYNFTVQFQFE